MTDNALFFMLCSIADYRKVELQQQSGHQPSSQSSDIPFSSLSVLDDYSKLHAVFAGTPSAREGDERLILAGESTSLFEIQVRKIVEHNEVETSGSMICEFFVKYPKQTLLPHDKKSFSRILTRNLEGAPSKPFLEKQVRAILFFLQFQELEETESLGRIISFLVKSLSHFDYLSSVEACMALSFALEKLSPQYEDVKHTEILSSQDATDLIAILESHIRKGALQTVEFPGSNSFLFLALEVHLVLLKQVLLDWSHNNISKNVAHSLAISISLILSIKKVEISTSNYHATNGPHNEVIRPTQVDLNNSDINRLKKTAAKVSRSILGSGHRHALYQAFLEIPESIKLKTCYEISFFSILQGAVFIIASTLWGGSSQKVDVLVHEVPLTAALSSLRMALLAAESFQLNSQKTTPEKFNQEARDGLMTRDKFLIVVHEIALSAKRLLRKFAVSIQRAWTDILELFSLLAKFQKELSVLREIALELSSFYLQLDFSQLEKYFSSETDHESIYLDNNLMSQLHDFEKYELLPLEQVQKLFHNHRFAASLIPSEEMAEVLDMYRSSLPEDCIIQLMKKRFLKAEPWKGLSFWTESLQKIMQTYYRNEKSQRVKLVALENLRETMNAYTGLFDDTFASEVLSSSLFKEVEAMKTLPSEYTAEEKEGEYEIKSKELSLIAEAGKQLQLSDVHFENLLKELESVGDFEDPREDEALSAKSGHALAAKYACEIFLNKLTRHPPSHSILAFNSICDRHLHRANPYAKLVVLETLLQVTATYTNRIVVKTHMDDKEKNIFSYGLVCTSSENEQRSQNKNESRMSGESSYLAISVLPVQKLLSNTLILLRKEKNAQVAQKCLLLVEHVFSNSFFSKDCDRFSCAAFVHDDLNTIHNEIDAISVVPWSTIPSLRILGFKILYLILGYGLPKMRQDFAQQLFRCFLQELELVCHFEKRDQEQRILSKAAYKYLDYEAYRQINPFVLLTYYIGVIIVSEPVTRPYVKDVLICLEVMMKSKESIFCMECLVVAEFMKLLSASGVLKQRTAHDGDGEDHSSLDEQENAIYMGGMRNALIALRSSNDSETSKTHWYNIWMSVIISWAFHFPFSILSEFKKHLEQLSTTNSSKVIATALEYCQCFSGCPDLRRSAAFNPKEKLNLTLGSWLVGVPPKAYIITLEKVEDGKGVEIAERRTTGTLRYWIHYSTSSYLPSYISSTNILTKFAKKTLITSTKKKDPIRDVNDSVGHFSEGEFSESGEKLASRSHLSDSGNTTLNSVEKKTRRKRHQVLGNDPNDIVKLLSSAQSWEFLQSAQGSSAISDTQKKEFSVSHFEWSLRQVHNEVIKVIEIESLARDLGVLDRVPAEDTQKIGIVYIGEGDDHEDVIFGNICGSSSYLSFLKKLGQYIKLGATTTDVFSGGLDMSGRDVDGEYGIYWRDPASQVIFHTVTLMPNTTKGGGSLRNKKRHVGNDHVNIIWLENGNEYDPKTLPGAFNTVHIVITPGKAGYFHVNVMKNKREMELFGPLLPDTPHIVQEEVLADLVRTTALNAERACATNPPNWMERIRQISRIHERIVNQRQQVAL